MTRQVFTHEHHNCGDQLIHLHLVRALAKLHPDTFFTHFCNGCHHENLREVIADLPNILLAPFESPLWQERQHESIGVWKNEGASDTRSGQVQNYQKGVWENSPNRWFWSAYTLELHKRNAHRMGFESPFHRQEHLLFDYPALEKDPGNLGEFDFLIGDSKPCSGQFSPMADHTIDHLAPLLNGLLKKGHRIICTEISKAQGNTVSRIGVLSQKCKHSIMVANAPFFCTLNVHNHHSHEGRRRIVLLDNGETLNMPHIIQMSSVEQVLQFAKEEKWL